MKTILYMLLGMFVSLFVVVLFMIGAPWLIAAFMAAAHVLGGM